MWFYSTKSKPKCQNMKIKLFYDLFIAYGYLISNTVFFYRSKNFFSFGRSQCTIICLKYAFKIREYSIVPYFNKIHTIVAFILLWYL